MTAKKEREAAEAVERLRKILRVGDTIKCVLRHVSASGMSRRIDFYVLRGGESLYLSGLISSALGYRRSDKGGVVVGGCGMDMGFAVVHQLGYPLWGDLAGTGTTKKATKLRERIAAKCGAHLTQGGQEVPDVTKPDDKWRHAAAYCLRSEWM